MRRSIQAFALALMIVGLTTSRSRADSVFDVTIPSDSTPGTLDFTITSSDGAALSAFSLGLSISQTSTSTSSAYFSLDPLPYSNPNYVFGTMSADSGFPFFWFPIPQGASYPLSIVGGDSDSSGSVTLSPTPAYLATAEFEVPTGADPGQQFQITLSSFSGYTYFDDLNGNPLNYTVSLVGGAVNIDVSAVPEPSSLALASISCLAGLVVLWRSRGRRRATASPSTRS